jgi:hypothetical protein
MITSSLTLNTKKGPSPITRAKFGPGMLLQSEDLEQLTLYTRDLSRLLFRSFFGCGVVCGLTVSAKDSCGQTMVTVDAGVALGCVGDPIYVPKSVTFAATDGCDPDNRPSPLYVWLCSCPKCCAPRTPSCGCDEGDSTPACTREVDWYEIHLGTEKPECACGCELPYFNGDTATHASGDAAFGGNGPVIAPENPDDFCQCVDPKSDCYKDHYAGVCGCKCDDSSCVMLALLTYVTKPDKNEQGWIADYSVRRFIRPVLMRDPLAVAPAAQKTSDASPAVAEQTVPKETVSKRTVPKKARK